MKNVQFKVKIAEDGIGKLETDGNGYVVFVNKCGSDVSGAVLMAEGILPPTAIMSAMYNIVTRLTEQFDLPDTVVLTNLLQIGLVESLKKNDRMPYDDAIKLAVNKSMHEVDIFFNRGAKKQ